MNFKLPNLPYNYDDLEPFFDEKTMKIHHTKHHQNYVNNTNNVLKNFSIFNGLSIEDIVKKIVELPEKERTVLQNNAGGHLNHNLFWKGLKKGTSLEGKLKYAIEHNFSSINNFKEIFEKIAVSHFGSGWIWLIKKNEKLLITTTKNQDNPLMGEKIVNIAGYPIIGLDLWEHAYYLKYQNRRIEYIKNFWNILNWDEAAFRFNEKI